MADQPHDHVDLRTGDIKRGGEAQAALAAVDHFDAVPAQVLLETAFTEHALALGIQHGAHHQSGAHYLVDGARKLPGQFFELGQELFNDTVTEAQGLGWAGSSPD